MTMAVCHVMPALTAPRQVDMWTTIETQTDDDGVTKPPPLAKDKATYLMTVRRSMSHESLCLCTESLGCETGTRGDFLDQAAIMACLYAPPSHQTDDATADSFPAPALQEEEEQEETAGELRAVRYHRARPQRAFPPPLPSMSRRHDDGRPCLRVRPHRRDGRLVLEAVAARPQGYLHARRQGGRLRLCFVDCSSARDGQQGQSMAQQPHQEQMLQEEDDVIEEEEEEEDEVEVVDRGTVVEVMAASAKAQRCSRIVINKFVGGAPATTDDANTMRSPSRCCRGAEDEAAPLPAPGLRRVPSSTTTLAAAVAAASTGMQMQADEEEEEEGEEKKTLLLFTSRVGDREELMQSVRRCRQLRQKPLFIVEPYSIVAT